MNDSPVRYSLEDGLAVITLDDGRANALSHAVLDGLESSLDQAEKDEAAAIVMTGRPGRFCAGFDLSVMTAGPRECRGMVEKGAHVFLRMVESERPIVVACTGHALAGGAVWLSCVDWRIGADVDAKIGLNEVAIGMPLPIFAVEMARARLSARHFLAATAHAQVYAPREAVEAGWLDGVAAPENLRADAKKKAAALGALRNPAYTLTKRTALRATVRLIRDTLEEDMDRIG
jgi:enoyl-CoA hydratase